MDRQLWINKSVDAIVDKLLKDIDRWDNASITREEMTQALKDTVHFSLEGTYDVGFNDGLGERGDEDDEGESIEFDLDELQKLDDDNEEDK